jgi:hypothetical protein
LSIEHRILGPGPSLVDLTSKPEIKSGIARPCRVGPLSDAVWRVTFMIVLLISLWLR